MSKNGRIASSEIPTNLLMSSSCSDISISPEFYPCENADKSTNFSKTFPEIEKQLMDLQRENKVLKRQLFEQQKNMGSLVKTAELRCQSPPNSSTGTNEQYSLLQNSAEISAPVDSTIPIIQSAVGSAFYPVKEPKNNNSQDTLSISPKFKPNLHNIHQQSTEGFFQNYLLHILMNQRAETELVQRKQKMMNVLQNLIPNKELRNNQKSHQIHRKIYEQQEYLEPDYKQMKMAKSVCQESRNSQSPALPDSSSEMTIEKEEILDKRSSSIIVSNFSNVIRSTHTIPTTSVQFSPTTSSSSKYQSLLQSNHLSSSNKDFIRPTNDLYSGFLPLEISVIKKSHDSKPRPKNPSEKSNACLAQTNKACTSTSVLSSILSATRTSPTVPESRTEYLSGVYCYTPTDLIKETAMNRRVGHSENIDIETTTSANKSSDSSENSEDSPFFGISPTSNGSGGGVDSRGSEHESKNSSFSEHHDGRTSFDADSFESISLRGIIPEENGAKDQVAYERYMDRRRRNNEAAKRCRANRRATFEQRSKKVLMLETENADLRQELLKLSIELEQLKTIIAANNKLVRPT